MWPHRPQVGVVAKAAVRRTPGGAPVIAVPSADRSCRRIPFTGARPRRASRDPSSPPGRVEGGAHPARHGQADSGRRDHLAATEPCRAGFRDHPSYPGALRPCLPRATAGERPATSPPPGALAMDRRRRSSQAPSRLPCRPRGGARALRRVRAGMHPITIPARSCSPARRRRLTTAHRHLTTRQPHCRRRAERPLVKRCSAGRQEPISPGGPAVARLGWKCLRRLP